MVKRFRIVIVVLLLVCIMAALQTVGYAANVEIKSEQNDVLPGETVKVEVVLDQKIEGCTLLEYKLYFDENHFLLKNSIPGDAHASIALSAEKQDANGAYYSISFVDPTSSGQTIQAGTMYTFEFAAKEDALAGTPNAFALVFEVAWDENLNEVTHTAGDPVCIRIAVAEEEAEKNTVSEPRWFSDVHGAGHWAREAVDYVTEKGLFGGMSPTTFAPNIPMNRAMLMTVLARMDGQNTDGGSTWYEKGMQWAVDAGISDGTNPLGNITREQMAAMLYRYSGNPDCDGELTVFPDYRGISTYAVNAMKWAVAEGLIHGMNGKLEPQGSATRAQVATILMRYMDLH